ncbi:hypothetical protein SKAU_G00163390 [Synaphobranchus kaupii]|uniref:Uncharacterized protein n=1 Tax=Synaphobranchus kaupii TaxID=118154 RepID=A0A9Q1FJE9_SYNKA|nr:hypothetical protein SKAU_G00163390 [Synaphobranchus kaupii]
MLHAPVFLLPRKRRRPPPRAPPLQGPQEVRFQEVTIYLVERKMGFSRRTFLTSLARTKGFRVADHLRTPLDRESQRTEKGSKSGGLTEPLEERSAGRAQHRG